MITELKPTNLIAVEVAPDASNYRWGHHVFGIIICPNDLCYDTFLNVWKEGDAIVPDGKYKILGEVTKDKIGFDVEPYVEKLNGGYADYANGGNILKEKILNKEESFYSLLAANEIYFGNPLKGAQVPILKWHYYEEKLIRGKLLILEKL